MTFHGTTEEPGNRNLDFFPASDTTFIHTKPKAALGKEKQTYRSTQEKGVYWGGRRISIGSPGVAIDTSPCIN
jgi:hypothetical protein